MSSSSSQDPGHAVLPQVVRDLQARVEALYLREKALEQEVKILRETHPVVGVRTALPGAAERALWRILPGRRRQFHIDMIRQSGFLDPGWYRTRYSDVRQSGADPATHYYDSGAGEKRDPGPHFRTAHYLEMYPDIAQGDLNPLVHYLLAGCAEGRSIRPGMPHRDPAGAG